MDNAELFGNITRIAQGNIQEVLKPMLQRIIALEEALDAKGTAPEVVHGPDDIQLTEEDTCVEQETEEESDSENGEDVESPKDKE